MFNEYFKQLKEKIKTESYTEHTLRTPFENLLDSIKTNTNIHIEHEPKSKKGLGRPDFEIFKNAKPIDPSKESLYTVDYGRILNGFLVAIPIYIFLLKKRS